MRSSVVGAIIVIGILGAAGRASAREIIVEPKEGQPALGDAVRAAADGDTIRVRPGVYRETIVVDKKIAVAGDPGATIDPSEPFNPDWQPARAIGKGAFRAAVGQRPRALMLDGKLLAELSEKRTNGDGPWVWKKVLASGAPRSGFKFIRAVWIYIEGERAIYLHLADDANPAGLKWSILYSNAPAVTFKNAAGASIRGLTLAHGFIGVSLTDNSSQCTVSNCTVGPFERVGIAVTGGASNCLVEKNTVFRGAYEDWNPADTSKERYEIWQVHKLAGFYDRVGISLVRAGRDNRVMGNHVFETFDGIDIGDSSVESLDIPLEHPEHGRGTEIADNLIERTRDSGIELGVGCIEVRVHNNVLRTTHGGLRFKLPRIGPVFIYRNVLEGGLPFNIWYSMDDSPAEGYVYHNTIVGGKVGLAYSSFNKPHGIGAPRWHYLNNLVVAERGFFENWRTKAPVNFTADYNVVRGGGKPWPEDPQKDAHSRYVKELELDKDLHPAAASPAVDAGLDLSAYFHGRPLPGCEPGYFLGKAPDAGAFEVR